MRRRQYTTISPYYHRFDTGGYTDAWNNAAHDYYMKQYMAGNSDLTGKFDSNGNLTLDLSDKQMNDYMNSKGGLFNMSKKDNPFSKGNIGSTMGAVAGALAQPVGGLLNKGISGGLSSKAGNTISSLGSTIGSAVGNFNPLIGAAVTVGSNIIGGVTNAAFGTKWNKENIKSVESNIANMRSAASGLTQANTTQSLLNNYGKINKGFDFSNKFIGKDGWFSNKAKKKANALRNQQNVARDVVRHGLVTGASNVDTVGDDSVFSKFAAYGGPLDIMANDNGMGAIGYGFMSDYMNMKNNQTTGKNTPTGYLGNLPSMFADGGGIHIAKSKEGTYKAAADRRGISMSELADRIKANPENYSPALRKKANFYNNFARHKKSDGGNLLIGNNGDTLFALGGDMQTNGGDYSDGLKEINAGKSHEENPYQGVQMGVAPDGSPNLVEEGETIFDDEDYVFSNRIHPKKEVLKKFHMYSKGGKLTYADVSKRLEKEAKERPNDPISKASLKDMLTMLMDAQEQQKAEEEAKEAKKAFEALSPEEQKAVLEQIAQQQQAQANAEQQANPQEEQEVPTDENGNPIEQTEEMPNQEDIAQNDEGSMSAYGGRLHKFPNGGQILRTTANGNPKNNLH